MVSDYEFECTCGARPQQFDVIRKSDGKVVGYIRCRWGYVVAHPVFGDSIDWDTDIYSESYDDGWQGVIEDTAKVFTAVAEELDRLEAQGVL